MAAKRVVVAAKRSDYPDHVTDKLPYEELRLKRIEENRKRLKDIGLFEQASLFRKNPSKATTPKKTVRRSTFVLEKSVVETRRSPRLTRNPSISYKEAKVVVLEEGCRRSRGVGRVLKRGIISSPAKTEAALRATKVCTEYPSFVKAMLKSHVSGGFWLGLPHAFCKMHFSTDILVTLEDEDGLEWETVYLHNKSGLSGGWRGFSVDHGLEDGDALVFELVKPTRFKVHITRASDRETDLDQEAEFRKRSYRYALKENKENEHVNSPLHKILKREQLMTDHVGKSISPNRAKSVKPSRKRKLDLSGSSARDSSGGREHRQVESESVEVLSSEDGCPDYAGLTAESSGQSESARRIVRNRGPATKGVAKSAISQDIRAPKSRIQRATGHQPQKTNSDTRKRKVPQDNPTPAVDQEKGVVFTKKARVTKKEVEQNLNVQMAKKNTPKLPPGTKLKAVGFCSIAGNCSSARKLPGRASKYSFFSPGKRATTKAH